MPLANFGQMGTPYKGRNIETLVASPYGIARFDSWAKDHPPMPGEYYTYLSYTGSDRYTSAYGKARGTLVVCIDKPATRELIDLCRQCGFELVSWIDERKTLAEYVDGMLKTTAQIPVSFEMIADSSDFAKQIFKLFDAELKNGDTVEP